MKGRWLMALSVVYPLMLATALPAQAPGERQAVISEETSHFLVSKIVIQSGTKESVEQRGDDAILVAFGEGVTLHTKALPSSVPMKDEEARFVARGVDLLIENAGTEAATLIIVRLKQHWDPEIEACSDFAKCTRPIRVSGKVIGETTSLFTNGFVTAYKHRLDPRGTLSSSYYSSRGKDHLLFIALSDISLNLDGDEESLGRGKVYASEATSADVDAGDREARWIVVRVQTPKEQ